MATTCNGCGNKICSNKFMECSLCTKAYDLACVKVTTQCFLKYSQEYKNKWVCPACLCNRPKSDNSCTPVRSPCNITDIKSPIDNVNKSRGSRPKVAQQPTTPGDDSALLLSEIRQLRQEVLDLKQQNQDIGSKLTSVSETLNHKFEEFDKIMAAKDNEITFLKQNLSELQQKIHHQEQRSIKNELEIMGIPECNNESLTHIVMVTAQKIGIELCESDIDEVTRSGPRRQAEPEKPRPIVLTLTRRNKKNEFIKAAKTRRTLTSSDIVNGSSQRVYVNERLTQRNRMLFRESRKRAQAYTFRYCWIKNGTIYVRKSEKLPSFPIRSYEDLDNKVGLPTNNDAPSAHPPLDPHRES